MPFKELKSQFKSAIKLGTGRAHLILQAHPNVNFSKIITKAAIHNYSYDQQSEGNRADYIFELIQLSQKKAKIRRAILNALAKENHDYWAVDQLFDLAGKYALQGDEEARQALYQRFGHNTVESTPWTGEELLVKIDGFSGLLHVLKTKFSTLPEEDWNTVEFSIIDHYQGIYPEIDLYAQLETVSQNESWLKELLRIYHAQPVHQTSSSLPKSPYSYELVMEKIRSKANSLLPPHAVKDLSTEDIQRLADDFLQEKDPTFIERFLRIFGTVKFPYHHQPIFDLAQGKIGKDRIAEFALEALCFFKDPVLRNYALSTIAESKHPELYTDLLINNYETGDGEILENLVRKAKNQHKIHALVWSYAKIYKANPGPDCKAPLVALYDRMVCGIHRKEIVKIMLTAGVLPERIRGELRYDSYLDTRTMITTIQS